MLKARDMKRARRCWCALTVVAAVVAVSSLVGCDSDEAPQTCGEVVCGERQSCNDTGVTPVCECEAKYTGAGCGECAPGYEAAGDDCVAVEIDCSDDPCGIGGECERGRGTAPDRCECLEAYTGPTCGQCVAGYQDHDDNGSCEPSCDVIGDTLSCDPGLVCVDTDGTAVCGCPLDAAGDGCMACRPGHYRVGDGPCVPSCEALDGCTEGQHCYDDRASGARCVCDVGYAAPTCRDCADGFERQGEACVRAAPPGSIQALVELEGKVALAAVDPDNGVITSLRALPPFPDDVEEPQPLALAREPISGRLFLGVQRRISPTSLDTMLVELLDDGTYRTIEDPVRGLLAVAPGTTTVYGRNRAMNDAGTWDDQLVSLDVDAGEAPREVGFLELGSATLAGMAFDEGGSLRAVTRDPGGERIERHHIDLGTAEKTLDGEAPLVDGIDPGTLRQLAIVGDELRMIAVEQPDDETLDAMRCRDAARRFGYAGHAEAVITPGSGPSGPTTAFEAPTTELRSQLASGPEIIISVSYGSQSPVELVVASDNPDAFICVLTFEADLTLWFAAGARFAAGFLHSYDATVDAVVDTGFAMPAEPTFTIHVTRATPDADLIEYQTLDPSFAAHPELFRIFTHAAWRARLLTDIESSSSTALLGPRLVGIDAAGAMRIVAPLDSPVIALDAR